METIEYLKICNVDAKVISIIDKLHFDYAATYILGLKENDILKIELNSTCISIEKYMAAHRTLVT